MLRPNIPPKVSMNSATFLQAEQEILSANRQGVNVEISMEQARLLLATGNYRESFGSPAHAHHYRRSLDDGSCLHLIILDERAVLHCDRFDPALSPSSLFWHLLIEARGEAVASASLAWYLFSMAVR